jgi:hypothetical protein
VVETSFKTLIDRLRNKPEWQHPDPAVRAEAVLRLGSAERETLLAIARADADARVRRAAVKKIADPAALAALRSGDADEGVRDEAEVRLAHLAVHEAEPAALQAVALLRDARHLAAVVKAAPLAPVREAALRALSDPRSLAAIVREAADPSLRLLALGRIEDAATLAALAQKTDQKAVALAAVERLSDAGALRVLAEKARVPAAARRARAKLDALPGAGPAAAEAAAPPVPADDADEAERRAYEEARAAHEREARTRAEANAAWTALCEATEAAEGEAVPAALERARADRPGLPALPPAEAASLGARLEAAIAAAESRHAAYQAGLARRDALEAIVREAEGLAAADPVAPHAALSALERSWAEATAGADLEDLRERFQAAIAAGRARAGAVRAGLAQRDQAHLQQLEALASRAEALLAQAAAAPLREADQTLREVREALEHPGHFPTRRDREAALARLEAARKQLYPLLQQLREDAEWKRWANVNVQEELCAEMEALLGEKDAERAAAALRDLDARWKQAKEAPKEKAEALWTRFKAARERLKERTDAFFAKQAEEHAANLAKKEDLCARAEALAESTDWLKTAEQLRALQAEWKAVGPVPRGVSQKVWERFRKPCDRFFTRWHEHRDQRSHEWADNLARKEALCERAESLAGSTEWDAASAEIKKLQAEWRSIGAVKKSRSDAVWQRFRAACDLFFDRYKNRDEHARLLAREAREQACATLEALLGAEGTAAEAPADLVATLSSAQSAWRQAGGLPQDELAAFEARFAAARDRVIAAFPAAFAGTELDPEASRKKAEKLAARAEAILEELAPGPSAAQATSSEELVARLRDALASNTIGGRAAVEAKWQAAADELEAAQAAWRRLGPLVGDEGRALAERFETACRRFAERRPRVERPRPDRSDRPRHDAARRAGPRDRDRGPRPRRP